MELNEAKVNDAIKAAVYNRQDPDDKKIAVFIETCEKANVEQEGVLTRLGARAAGCQENIWTAVLSETAVIDLSNQPWVKFLHGDFQMGLFDPSAGVEPSVPGANSIFHHPV